MRQSLDIAPHRDQFHEIPYDLYCPSLCSEANIIQGRTCDKCGLYFCSKKAVLCHKKIHKKQKKSNELIREENDDEEGEDGDRSEEKDENGKEEKTSREERDSNDGECTPVITIEQSAHIPWADD